jgi:hypothetical protein
MVAGIPVPSIVDLILLGLANNDIQLRWSNWLERQIKDPDMSTTAYFVYNRFEPFDVYEDLFNRLFKHFIEQPRMHFQGCSVIDVKIRILEDDFLSVGYRINYTHPTLCWNIFQGNGTNSPTHWK